MAGQSQLKLGGDLQDDSVSSVCQSSSSPLGLSFPLEVVFQTLGGQPIYVEWHQMGF